MSLLLMLPLLMNANLLAKDLAELKAVDMQDPKTVLSIYKEKQRHYALEPSKGLLEIHKIGFKAAIINRDTEVVEAFAELIQRPNWFELVEPELPFLISNFGIYYRFLSKYQASEQTYLCAKSLAKDPKFLSTIDNNLGVLYLSLDRLDDAQKMFSYAKKHLQGDEEDLHSINSNLANIHFLKKQYGAAVHLYESSFMYFVRKQDTQSAVHIGINLLIAALEDNNFSTYHRYKSKVTELVNAFDMPALKLIMQWLYVYQIFLESAVLPDIAVQHSLINSMESLSKMDISGTIDTIVKQLNLPKLSIEWKKRAVPLTTSVNMNLNDHDELVKLKWCESQP
ncbi:hypothetical protein PALB_24820 [Pseudoalteromonas luteoviolacea B = ATCC 29581]|nr:hypothetical protein PALB_24820 [Pseudoalteromonas luteoviolacea B = ATCC 29581]